jgi:hypothetical protein
MVYSETPWLTRLAMKYHDDPIKPKTAISPELQLMHYNKEKISLAMNS